MRRAARGAAPKGHEVAHFVARADRIPSGDRRPYPVGEGLS